ncbi:MAG: acyltransferase domain-containing protein [Devosia sp.]|nr:acyltransferase domain-containing protein [Devosia sp.]
MDLNRVCDIIELPAPVKRAVIASGHLPEVKQAEQYKALLYDRATWGDGVRAVATTLGEDPNGMKMLAFMLLRAAETHARYVAMAVDDTIFADTMKFCTRFVLDHQEHYGTYAFTWGWWFPRQLSFQEFRIGTLEYELIETDKGRSISIHIPGDATLSLDALRQSYLAARATIARIAPDFAAADMFCDSWMLSPVLHDLLPARSNILAFQESFDLIEIDPANRHATRWIFGRDDLPLTDLSEGTSLQRNTKALLLKGGNIGSAVGKLRADPWRSSP